MDRHLNSLTMVYDATGVLTHIHDDDHLLVVRLHHENGRLREVWQQSEDGSHERLLVSDADGDATLSCEYGEPHGLLQALYYPGGRESHYRWQQFDAWTDNTGDTRPAHWRVVEHWIQEGAKGDKPPVRLEHYLFDYDVPGQSLRLVQEGRGESVLRWDALEQITEQTILQFSATFINCYTEDDVPVIGISDDPCKPEHFLIISQFIDGDDSIDESIGLQTHLSEQEFSGVIDSVALSRQQLHITIREEKAAAVGMRTIIADLRVSVEQWDILAGYMQMICTGGSVKITLSN